MVQEAILLDSNWKKVTSLQIIAQYFSPTCSIVLSPQDLNVVTQRTYSTPVDNEKFDSVDDFAGAAHNLCLWWHLWTETFLLCVLLAVKVIPWVEFAVRCSSNNTQHLFQQFVQGQRCWRWFQLIAFGNDSENAERVTSHQKEHQMCITLIRFWCWICKMPKTLSLKNISLEYVYRPNRIYFANCTSLKINISVL